MRSYWRLFDTVFPLASGSTLVDADDREYTDFLAGCSSPVILPRLSGHP